MEPNRIGQPRARLWARALAAVLGAAILLGGVRADAATPDVLSLADAEAAAATADARFATAEADLQAAVAARTDLEAALAQAEDETATNAVAMADARQEATSYAVERYMSGGGPAELEYLLDSDDAGDLAERGWLLDDRNSDADAAADEYLRLRNEASAEAAGLAASLDEARQRVSSAEAELASATEERRVARQRLFAAVVEEARRQREEQERQMAELVEASRPPDGDDVPGGVHAVGPGWAMLRRCESSGDYQAVSSSGKYRGAYQFDTRTWESVGGVGDPAAATPAEQDLRAQILYDQRGSQPWPICGRYLN